MKSSIRVAIILAALLLSLSGFVSAQRELPAQDEPVAKRSTIYCTGFITEALPPARVQVVGGEKENYAYSFTQGDIVYLNKGRENGVQPGAYYYVIRPLGKVKHPFKKKDMGYLVRELGMLRVVETQARTATAEIVVSCDTIELGDLLKPYEEMNGPAQGDARPLPRFTEGNGQSVGQIIMSSNFSEYMGANQVVYIDLGNKQGVRVGDYFTIYRHIDSNSERVAKMPSDDIVQEKSGGYGSDHYRGGDFSMSSTREPRDKVLRTRPSLPRKVLGELIVLKVENSSAVALITRTTAEVNIGDFIERNN